MQPNNFLALKSLNFEASTTEEQNLLDNLLGDFNISQVPATQKKHLIPFSYHLKKDGVIIAGINADMYYWHILYITILFVDKQYRQQKLGSQLLKKVETKAKAMGAKLVHLDTFDFQARGFYEKHGYEVFGILENCPEGHKRYYMKKVL